MKPKIENAHRVSLSIADKPRAIICKFIYRPEPGFSKKAAPDDWSPLTLGFIAAYFVFKSLFFSLFCFASLLELFPNFSSFLARLWSKQNRETCLWFWTRSMNAILLESRRSRWNMVTSPYVPKWRPSVPTRCRKNLLVSLASRKADRRMFYVLNFAMPWYWNNFLNSLSARRNFLSLWKLTYFNVTISRQDLTTSCTINKVFQFFHHCHNSCFRFLEQAWQHFIFQA